LILSWDTGNSDIGFCGLPQNIPSNDGMVPQFRLDCFLPNSFLLFISHYTTDAVQCEVLTGHGQTGGGGGK
jgi:hypothetical protein